MQIASSSFAKSSVDHIWFANFDSLPAAHTVKILATKILINLQPREITSLVQPKPCVFVNLYLWLHGRELTLYKSNISQEQPFIFPIFVRAYLLWKKLSLRHIVSRSCGSIFDLIKKFFSWSADQGLPYGEIKNIFVSLHSKKKRRRMWHFLACQGVTRKL